jgi:hypothetical protein
MCVCAAQFIAVRGFPCCVSSAGWGAQVVEQLVRTIDVIDFQPTLEVLVQIFTCAALLLSRGVIQRAPSRMAHRA